MHLFSSKKIYTKAVSFFVTFMFLVESTFLPIISLLPRVASAQTAPILSVSPASLAAGANLTMSVSGAPNVEVKIFCRDPNNVVCDDAVSGITNGAGQFSRTYNTTGWTSGTHRGWVTVNGVRSNEPGFVIIS